MPNIEWDGLDELRDALAEFGPRVRLETSRAMRVEGEFIMTRAKRLTPVDTGTLRASGRVQQRTSNDVVSVELTFGGPAREYAIYVHEMTWVRHKIGQAKFLEQPVLEHSDQFFAAVVDRVETAIAEQLGGL